MITPSVGSKVVWILGAGFSRGLGGPLIKQLLAPREKRVLSNHFPNRAEAIEAILKARAFFQWGKDAERGYWDDAEQFLDSVESAAAEKPPALSHAVQVLTAMLRGTVPQPAPPPSTNHSGVVMYTPPKYYDFDSLADLAKACRTALAIDCSIFLRSAQLNSEKWAPFTHWASILSSHHTVITFNYDQVPELLAKLPDSKLEVVHPQQVELDLENVRKDGKAPVLKVHGSVTWRLAGQKVDVVDVHDKTVGDPGVEPVLGVPGPGKRNLVAGALKDVWNAAISEVMGATMVLFVGYRFPPTDADSRVGLLRAIASNGRKDRLTVATVLGPWVTEADSKRLQHLLESVTTGTVRAIPLLAEDFVGLWPGVRI